MTTAPHHCLLDEEGAATTLIAALQKASRRFSKSKAAFIAQDHLSKTLTYKQLLLRSFVLARLIERLTDKNDRYIGIMLPNVTATLIAFWGIQALGRTAVMLNYTTGLSHLHSACKITRLQTVLTSRAFIQTTMKEDLIAAMQGWGVNVLFLEDLPPRVKARDKAHAFLDSMVFKRLPHTARQAQANDPAVVLFTSGSEGPPKGVALSHANILSNHRQILQRISLSSADSLFNCLPLFHSFGLTVGMLLPLMIGLPVYFYPSPLHYQAVPEALRKSGATIFLSTDTFLSGYARHASRASVEKVRLLFTGAEKLRADTIALWSTRFGIDLLEGYGVTEASPVIALNTPEEHRAGTVGKILPEINVRLEACAAIKAGQRLFIKGPNVMLGYIKEEHPQSLCPLDNGWHDTGDIVHIDSQGYLTIVGRARRFAKIGGEMVSLTLIEELIASTFPQARYMALTVPDTVRGESIVLLTEDDHLSLDAVHTLLTERGLANFMVPRKLIKTDRLPVFESGKLDFVQGELFVRNHLAQSPSS